MAAAQLTVMPQDVQDQYADEDVDSQRQSIDANQAEIARLLQMEEVWQAIIDANTALSTRLLWTLAMNTDDYNMMAACSDSMPP